MSPFRRALTYIVRKRGKSLLLLLLFLVTATLALSGTAIRAAVRTAQLNVRQALGGVFTMEQNTSDPDKWQSRAVGGFGYQSWYSGAPLTAELADTIMEKVDGIRGCNATATNYVVASDQNGKTLELIEADEDNGLNALLASYGDFGSTITAYISTNTAFDSSFTGGYLELVSGRHITAEDSNAVMISRELAEQNGLAVGDRIILSMSEFQASLKGVDAVKTKLEVEIAGLFHATAKSSAMLSNWSMDNAIYTTMDVIRHVRPETPDDGYEKINFYVDDPARLKDIVAQVKALPEIDPTDFIVQSDSSSADSVSEPLANMDRLVSVLILLVLLAGTAILYFTLAGRMKERVHESGILLSLGFSRANIALQYLTEVLVIALLALSLSIFTSAVTAKAIGGRLLDYTADTGASDSESNPGMPGTAVDGGTILRSDDLAPKFEGQSNLTNIEVVIPPSAILCLYGFGAALILFSVTAAAMPVLRMKPREILARMS